MEVTHRFEQVDHVHLLAKLTASFGSGTLLAALSGAALEVAGHPGEQIGA